MDKVNGAQSVRKIQDRNIVYSAGVGKTNTDELLWLMKTVLEEAAEYKEEGWAYIADCSKMKPVTVAESSVLVAMTKQFVEEGCKALGFIDENTIVLRTQAKNHTNRSETGVLEGHFATLEETLEWLKKEVNL